MKRTTTFLALLLTAFSYGQTDYTIYAQGMSWSNSNITIETGDSITFINDHEGVHNVNGTQQIYPDNPASFGRLTKGDNWVYGYRFLQQGRYDFRDDSYPNIMTGKVTVVDQLNLNENQLGSFDFSPNPVTSKIAIFTAWSDFNVEVIDMMGAKVLSGHLVNDNIIDVTNIPKGSYFLKISSDKGVYQERFIKI